MQGAIITILRVGYSVLVQASWDIGHLDDALLALGLFYSAVNGVFSPLTTVGQIIVGSMMPQPLSVNVLPARVPLARARLLIQASVTDRTDAGAN